MVETLAGKPQGSSNVYQIEIGQFFYHLLGGESVGEQVQDVTDSNPKAPDARPAAALLRVRGNPIGEVCHGTVL